MKTKYSTLLDQVQYNRIHLSDSAPFLLTCLSTKEVPFLIGTTHQIKINASFSKVIEIFEDFSGYADIFPGLKRVQLTQRLDPQQFIVRFESNPFPLVPNTIYSTLYKVRTSTPEQKIYTYQLYKTDDLNGLDGLVVIQKNGASETLYYEIDFLDAKWGMAETFAPKSIWRESVTEAVQSDFALKFRAEDPTKSLKKVKRDAELESTDHAMEKTIETCIKEKKDGTEFFKTFAQGRP